VESADSTSETHPRRNFAKASGFALAIEEGQRSHENNPLRNAPHTALDLADDDWNRPYSRRQACFPADTQSVHKYWPPVNRIDNVYGDRNLICSCPRIEEFAMAA
jgi:glycine dehydrogenase